jgi:hypothetical protein
MDIENLLRDSMKPWHEDPIDLQSLKVNYRNMDFELHGSQMEKILRSIELNRDGHSIQLRAMTEDRDYLLSYCERTMRYFFVPVVLDADVEELLHTPLTEIPSHEVKRRGMHNLRTFLNGSSGEPTINDALEFIYSSLINTVALRVPGFGNGTYNALRLYLQGEGIQLPILMNKSGLEIFQVGYRPKSTAV